MKKLLIAIAAYNEERTLGEVLRGVKNVMDNFLKNSDISYEILVVDDGSTDNTYKIAKENGAIVVRHFINLGVGQATKTKYVYAVRHNFDIIAELDADGQHPPEYLPMLIKPVLTGEADIVIGSRYLGTNYKSSIIRDFGNVFHSKLLSFISRRNLTDITSFYRVTKVEVLRELVNYNFPDTPAVFVTLKESLSNYKIKEVPVEMKLRMYGRSHLNWKKMLIYPIRTISTIIKILKDY